ncbi:putative Pentatricopeptide repeat-containing protein [Quillaja saponaria]|uniref:Pentatricopeptide repeat-containing protein n=1 Tax=Quillaja saponaria TaxID=32244 RepID=A0AAD7PXJ2_QUISA|nr:putative Pentatricopeptide repeat-containing protein [Quillaja saponaria]KAJ7971009.1 putative Pentatricopeptide repeat-containing protein [Quillaja saponaria]
MLQLQQCQATLSRAASLASMAEACVSMRDFKLIHAHSIRTYLDHHALVLGKMFRFAAVSPYGDLSYAHRLFSQMHQPNTFFYNILIRGYSKSSLPTRSVRLFNQMRQNCVGPDEFTFTFLLKSRSRMKLNLPLVRASDEIHGAVLKFGFGSHLFVQNALIHLYAARGIPIAARRVFEDTVGVDVVSWSGLVIAYVRAGELDTARRVFDVMPERDVVSWTAMVSGYSQAKLSREALDLFWEMRHSGVRPDEVTMVSVISACTNLGDMETGTSIHQFIDENGFGWMVSLRNALIDMYAKCGCMEQAWQVFSCMSFRSLITWNTMISACANHGNAEDAFMLFERMTTAGVLPDGVTFLALLVAYTHKGWVDEGIRVFESMQRDHGIEARIEHYGCMVDMLGRAGRLEEAYKLLNSMPIPSNDVIWGSLLAACRIHGNVDLGERVLKKLLELKPDEGGYYILLRDIYITAGRTEEANEMRQNMLISGATKTPGYSWVGA